MFIERKTIGAAIAIALLMLVAPRSFAAGARRADSGGPENPSSPQVALDAMAQQKFGASISAAERKLLHAAPLRDVPWFGPSDDADNTVNDPAHGDKWRADRTVRAEVIAWLLSDPQPAQFIHPSGLALAGARITGNLDLSYATVGKPLTLIRCYIPDGINLLSAHLTEITVRHSRTGAIFGNMAVIHGDATFIFGDYGPVSLMRARIDGTLDFTGSQILDPGDDAVNLVEA